MKISMMCHSKFTSYNLFEDNKQYFSMHIFINIDSYTKCYFIYHDIPFHICDALRRLALTLNIGGLREIRGDNRT